MAKQGKCISCLVRWEWEKEVSLRLAICPICRGPLQQTTYLSHLPHHRASAANIRRKTK